MASARSENNAAENELLQGERANVTDLTVHEKARLLAGANYWATASVKKNGAEVVPSITLTDGPNGVRKQLKSFDNLGISESVPATCFPCACTSACTFDEQLVELMGKALGEECRKENVQVVLGPGLNIKRHPLEGRSFEYFSEDPLLSGKMAAAFIRGVQSTGVGACPKHFVANSQETLRMVSDSVVDERTLNDVYMRGFEIAVREGGPACLMTAYNRLNGTYCSENAELLGKLRYEWGFDGTIVTDWGALSDMVPTVAAGLDLVMPGPRRDFVETIEAAVNNNQLSSEQLDSAAENVATLALRTRNSANTPFSCNYVEHLAIAQLVAEAGGVLLENDGTLPLQSKANIAVIGEFARAPRYQGSGSSKINPIHLDNALEAFEEAGFNVQFAPGYNATTGNADKQQLDEAVATASNVEVAVVFVGLPDAWESEGFDRANMNLPDGMNQLVSAVSKANKHTVVVLAGGGPVAMPWRKSVSAILAMHLAGCESGHATVKLLSGVVNPSGKLAETWPENVEQTALGSSFPERTLMAYYIEGPFVGYKYYDAAGVAPAYTFGYGLSYTSFDYSNLQVVKSGDGYKVTFDLTNTGKRYGAEVAQIYVAPRDPAVPMPVQHLAAFKKVHLQPGETKRVTLHLGFNAFAYWDSEKSCRRVDKGVYEVRLSSASNRIELLHRLTLSETAPFEVHDKPELTAEQRQSLNAYFDVKPHGFSKETFRNLYGAPLPEEPPKLPFTKDSPMGNLNETKFGRFLLKVIKHFAARADVSSDEAVENMMGRMFDEMPLRTIVMGGVPYNVVEALVCALNGHPKNGIKRLLKI